VAKGGSKGGEEAIGKRQERAVVGKREDETREERTEKKE
jgi:hypothetical protein